jgi:hypothetical protein
MMRRPTILTTSPCISGGKSAGGLLLGSDCRPEAMYSMLAAGREPQRCRRREPSGAMGSWSELIYPRTCLIALARRQ